MIKNDAWITEMAQKGMVKPFEPSLIREMEYGHPDNPQFRKVISYGTSSYGYDIRLSPKDFRIFRHIPGTVVDPKNFNPSNLCAVELHEDEGGSFFILPAHTYGLGVALEWISVPDDVTIVCIGKSTYARCFIGSTRVKLVDGDYTFLELIERAAKGDRLFGFGVLDGEIVVQELLEPRRIERSRILRVELDSGDVIDCTPDHRFMLRSGEMVEAQDLSPGISLRPIYQHHSHGYPTIYDSVKASSADKRQEAWTTTHKMVWECLVRNGEAEPLPDDFEIHHSDGDVFNSHPSNLEGLSSSEHARRHNAEDGRHIKGGQRYKELYASSEEFREAVSNRLHSEEAKRKANENGQRWKHSERNHQSLSQASQKRWQDPTQKEKQSEVAKRGMAALKRRDDINAETLTSALLRAGTLRGAAKALSVDRSAFRRFPEVISKFKAGTLQYNHKVLSIEYLDQEEDTYCLTAPETGNFALSAGVFASNCGVIANLTPAEAGFRGHLTLEFSNSSSADVRLYAWEGAVQLIFFQGEPCTTTYDDRAGKYQDQDHAVTIAIV